MAEGGGAAVWAAALALVGTRFRLHGRDPATGLDCVGLVAAAHRAAGHGPAWVPDRYALHGPGEDAARRWLAAAGLVAVTGLRAAGDVALCDMGLGQLHLLLLGPAGQVHAHAGLRRVVLMPGDVPGRLIGRWRLATINGKG